MVRVVLGEVVGVEPVATVGDGTLSVDDECGEVINRNCGGSAGSDEVIL